MGAPVVKIIGIKCKIKLQQPQDCGFISGRNRRDRQLSFAVGKGEDTVYAVISVRHK